MKSNPPKKELYLTAYLVYGKKYKAAAEILLKNDPDPLPLVTYHTICHALELLIKAYLKAMVFKEDVLKKDYGHDLEKLYRTAKNKGLDGHVSLSDSEVVLISKINRHYKKKELEYLILGFKSFPPLKDLKSVLDHLWNPIQQVSIQKSAEKAKEQLEAKKSPKAPSA